MDINNINKYKKFVENGDYQDSALEKMSDRYSQQYSESISHLDIIINSSRANIITKNGQIYKCVVDYGKLPHKPSLSNSQFVFMRELWTRQNDNVIAGDIVEFAHNLYDEPKVYLLLKTIETRDGYNLSVMQETVSSLKWLNTIGYVCEAPFVIKNNFITTSGTEDGRIINIGSENRQIVIQSNIETRAIKKDRRFIFDSRCWRVISVDRLQEGVISLVLEEHQFDPARDNLELEIADYNTINFFIVITNGNSQIALDQTLQLNVEAYMNGIINPDATVALTVNDENMGTIDVNNIFTPLSEGTVTITAEYMNATASIQIEVTNNQNVNLNVEIVGTDTITVNKSAIYSAVFTENGFPMSASPTFTLYADDGVSSTTLATLNQTGDTCTISAGSKTGYVQLYVRDSDGEINTTKRIRIKSLY